MTKRERQELAIASLISCHSLSAASRQSGIPERTLRTWLTEDDFRELYDRRRRDVVQSALTALQDGMNRAVLTLARIMQDGETPAAVRVSAAKAILENGFKATEIMDILPRLDALEAARNSRKQPN